MSGPPPPTPDVNIEYKQEGIGSKVANKYGCLFPIYLIVYCNVIYIPPSLEASDALSSLLASLLYSSSSGIAPTTKCPL